MCTLGKVVCIIQIPCKVTKYIALLKTYSKNHPLRLACLVCICTCMHLSLRSCFWIMTCGQREASEGQSKNESEAKKRVAENESSATISEAAYRTEAHVQVGACMYPD